MVSTRFGMVGSLRFYFQPLVRRMITVYYPTTASPDAAQALQDRVGGHAKVVTGEAIPHEAEMLIEGRPTSELLESLPSLRWIVVPFAGVPEATLHLFRQFKTQKPKSEIALHNLHHNAPETAELAIALLLAAAKQVVPMDAGMRSHDWSGRYEPSGTVRLEGKTAVVLGFGEIGKRVARSLIGLGMEVVALRRGSPSPRGRGGRGVRVGKIVDLHGWLPRADVLMICMPLTADTTGLLGPPELSLIKRGAILINIARAHIVDEEALFNALSPPPAPSLPSGRDSEALAGTEHPESGEGVHGRLHAAGLDVWYQYPQDSAGHGGRPVPSSFAGQGSAIIAPPSRFPFNELENVVMSPHRGGLSMENEASRIEHLAALIRAAANGDVVPDQVNLELGY